MRNWIYNNKEYLEAPDKDKYIGFVYLMEYDNYKYIGYKLFYRKTKTKVTKKEKLETGTRKRINRGHKESDWKTYYSSNTFLKSVENKDKVKRIILHLCTTEALAKYWELYEIVTRHALIPKNNYLNGNIQYKSFNNIFLKNEK